MSFQTTLLYNPFTFINTRNQVQSRTYISHAFANTHHTLAAALRWSAMYYNRCVTHQYCVSDISLKIPDLNEQLWQRKIS